MLWSRPERDTGRDGARLLHLLPVALPQGPGLLQGLQLHVLMNVLGGDVAELAVAGVAERMCAGVA